MYNFDSQKSRNTYYDKVYYEYQYFSKENDSLTHRILAVGDYYTS